MVRECLPEKVTIKQKFEGDERKSHVDVVFFREASKTKRTARRKCQKGCAWCVLEREVNEGKSSSRPGGL